MYIWYIFTKSPPPPAPCLWYQKMVQTNGRAFFWSDHWLHVVIKNWSVNLYFNLFYSYLCSRFWSPPKQGTETWVTLLWICWSCGPIPANRAITWLLALWIDCVMFILNCNGVFFTWRRRKSNNIFWMSYVIFT